jgi:hypothetical protein
MSKVISPTAPSTTHTIPGTPVSNLNATAEGPIVALTEVRADMVPMLSTIKSTPETQRNVKISMKRYRHLWRNSFVVTGPPLSDIPLRTK